MNIKFSFKRLFPKPESVPKKPLRHVYHWWFALVLISASLFVLSLATHSFVFWRAVQGSLFSSESGVGGATTGDLDRSELHRVLEDVERRTQDAKRLRESPPAIESLGTPAVK